MLDCAWVVEMQSVGQCYRYWYFNPCVLQSFCSNETHRIGVQACDFISFCLNCCFFTDRFHSVHSVWPAFFSGLFKPEVGYLTIESHVECKVVYYAVAQLIFCSVLKNIFLTFCVPHMHIYLEALFFGSAMRRFFSYSYLVFSNSSEQQTN